MEAKEKNKSMDTHTTKDRAKASAPATIGNASHALPALVADMLQEALQARATDIHIDPIGRDLYRICYRVDGHIHPLQEIPHEKGRHLINQIKVAAGFTPDHAFSALENRISLGDDDAQREVRVTIVPTTKREAAHLRILSPPDEILRPTELGLSEQHLHRIRQTLQRPEGLILITGSTGAGKTMTLYSLASFLDLSAAIAASVEDPVEYDLQYVRQIQSNPEQGLSMPHALKTVLRMDPDIILIGEIRDPQSALTAVRAAASGRFVLATMHATDMPLAVDACHYLSVPHHLLGSTLRMVISQSLLRRVCDACAEQRPPTKQEQQRFSAEEMAVPDQVPVARGCDACHHFGYRGQTGIFNATVIDDDLATAITNGERAEALRQRVDTPNPFSLQRDALAKVAAGITTMEEVQELHVPGNPGLSDNETQEHYHRGKRLSGQYLRGTCGTPASPATAPAVQDQQPECCLPAYTKS